MNPFRLKENHAFFRLLTNISGFPVITINKFFFKAGFFSLLVFLGLGQDIRAKTGEVRIGVASNFTTAAREIASVFSASTGHQVRLSFGSTGTLYTQILYGAPLDVFLAADEVRPAKIEQEGKAVSGTVFTYAIGRLVLYSRNAKLVDKDGGVLMAGIFERIAIANPKTAPYGTAAKQTLIKLGFYKKLSTKRIIGNNIAQTYQFVVTGNAELGLVALAQVKGHKGGSSWLVPENFHSPIRQNAVLLNRGKANKAALAFMKFLRSDEAQKIIRHYGYATQ